MLFFKEKMLPIFGTFFFEQILTDLAK